MIFKLVHIGQKYKSVEVILKLFFAIKEMKTDVGLDPGRSHNGQENDKVNQSLWLLVYSQSH